MRKLFCLLLPAPAAAFAQAWPAKPVRVISTFAAGSAADVSIRLVASKMQDALKSPEVTSKLKEVAFYAVGNSLDEYENTSKAVKSAGIQPE